MFHFKNGFVLRVLFSEQIDRDYSQLPVVCRLFGPWAVRSIVYRDKYMSLYLLFGLT